MIVSLLVRWPPGKRLLAEHVSNVSLAIEIIAKHHAKDSAEIKDRLNRGEILATPAFEYHITHIRR